MKYLRKIGDRAYSLTLVAVALSGIGTIAATNYIVDPLQRIRQAVFYPPQYDTQQRLQAPALARSATYDSLVLGTSTAENIFASDANPILGGRFLRLSISGGSPHEQRLVLDVALATGKPKRVLWLIDGFVLTQPAESVREEFGPFPYYMYDGGPAGLAHYLVNFEILRRSYAILEGLANGRLPPARDPERLNAGIDAVTFGRSKVIDAYHDPANRGAWAQAIERRMSSDSAVAAASIKANIAEVVRGASQVRFDLVLAPPSIAQLAYWSTHFPDFFNAVLAARRELARQTQSMGNVFVHDFWRDPAITDDLDRYTDMIHFDLRTTREILAGVASGRYRADLASIVSSEADLRLRVAAFLRREPPN